jgi:hypothetical protein
MGGLLSLALQWADLPVAAFPLLALALLGVSSWGKNPIDRLAGGGGAASSSAIESASSAMLRS